MGLSALLWLWLGACSAAVRPNYLAESNLPAFVIDTMGVPMVSCFQHWTCELKEIETNATMTVWGPDPVFGTQVVLAEYNIAMKLHGQSTLSVFPKQPYGFDTRTEFASEDNLDVTLLGLTESHKWVLKAIYGDQTKMRDALAFEISNRIGLYSSRVRWAEVYLIGNHDYINVGYNYIGLYGLQESIEQGGDKVAVSKNTGKTSPEDSGWILKLDKVDPDDIFYMTSRGTRIQIHYPKKKNASPAKVAWIGNWMQEFEDALYNDATMFDTLTGARAFIDFEAAALYFIVSELAVSVDGYRYSAYMSKNSCAKRPDDCKLKMGPVWDYNLAFGMTGWEVNDGDLSASLFYGWRFEYEHRQFLLNRRPEGPNVASWYARLLSDPVFAQTVRELWTSLRSGVLSDVFFDAFLDDTTQTLNQTGALERDLQKWQTEGKSMWPFRQVPFPQTFSADLEFMRNWIHQRVQWLDGAFQRPIYHSYTGLGSTCSIGADGWEAGCSSCVVEGPWPPQFPECRAKMEYLRGHWHEYEPAFELTADSCTWQNFLQQENNWCPSVADVLYCAASVCRTSPQPIYTPPPSPFPPRPTPPTLPPTGPTSPTTPTNPTVAPTLVPTLAPSVAPSVAPTSMPSSLSLSPTLPSSSTQPTTFPTPIVPSTLPSTVPSLLSPSFSPRPSVFPSPSPSALTPQPTHHTQSPTSENGGAKASKGNAAGLVVGVSLTLIVVLGAGLLYWRYARRRLKRQADQHNLLEGINGAAAPANFQRLDNLEQF